MKVRLILVLLITNLFVSVSGQDLLMPDLQGFKKIQNYPVFGPDKLWDFIDGAADNYLSYGFADLHVAEYKKGKDVIKLELYKFSSHLMAFGIYSSERSPSFEFLNMGSQGYITDGMLNFFKGEYYVKIRTYSKNEKTINSVRVLAQRVATMITGSSDMPPALALFPAKGKKANEEAYISENVLGHKFLDNAYRASYETGSDVFAIFILDKSSAEEVKKTVNDYLAAAGSDVPESETGRYMFKDGYNGTIFLAFKGNRIIIISGLSRDQSELAASYTEEILK
jgi:hypothetical protein